MILVALFLLISGQQSSGSYIDSLPTEVINSIIIHGKSDDYIEQYQKGYISYTIDEKLSERIYIRFDSQEMAKTVSDIITVTQGCQLKFPLLSSLLLTNKNLSQKAQALHQKYSHVDTKNISARSFFIFALQENFFGKIPNDQHMIFLGNEITFPLFKIENRKEKKETFISVWFDDTHETPPLDAVNFMLFTIKIDFNPSQQRKKISHELNDPLKVISHYIANAFTGVDTISCDFHNIEAPTHTYHDSHLYNYIDLKVAMVCTLKTTANGFHTIPLEMVKALWILKKRTQPQT